LRETQIPRRSGRRPWRDVQCTRPTENAFFAAALAPMTFASATVWLDSTMARSRLPIKLFGPGGCSEDGFYRLSPGAVDASGRFTEADPGVSWGFGGARRGTSAMNSQRPPVSSRARAETSEFSRSITTRRPVEAPPARLLDGDPGGAGRFASIDTRREAGGGDKGAKGQGGAAAPKRMRQHRAVRWKRPSFFGKKDEAEHEPVGSPRSPLGSRGTG